MRPKVLLTKPMSHYTPEEYMEYIRSLYMAHDQKESKRIQGVSLTKGRRGFRLTVRRENKSFTEQEIYLLAEEAGVAVEELTEFLHRTGRTIYNALGDKQNGPTKTQKTNVKHKPGKRKDASADQLFLFGTDQHLSA
jgi:hypothetical protein